MDQQKTFEEIVKEVVDNLPEDFSKRFNNLAFFVEDFPNEHQTEKMRLHNHYALLGLYEGVPMSKRGHYSGAIPDRITIFKKPIEARASSYEDLKKLIREVVLHEIGHYFGMNEEEVRRMERERISKQKAPSTKNPEEIHNK